MGEPFWLRLGRQRAELGLQALTGTGSSPLGFNPAAKWEHGSAPLPCWAQRPEKTEPSPLTRLRRTQRQKGGELPSSSTPPRAGAQLRAGLAGRAGSRHTWYVSHRRMVQRRGSSRMSRLFIQRKANCRYSTSYLLKWLCTCSETGSVVGPGAHAGHQTLEELGSQKSGFHPPPRPREARPRGHAGMRLFVMVGSTTSQQHCPGNAARNGTVYTPGMVCAPSPSAGLL